MKTLLKQNHSDFAEKRVLNFAGNFEAKAQEAVEAALDEKGKDGESLKEKAELGNLSGKELIEKAEEIASSLLEEGDNDAKNKTESMKATLDAFAEKLGISADSAKQIDSAYRAYRQEARNAQVRYAERMQDFNSDKEDYGGENKDGAFNLDDDISSAVRDFPNSKTAKAYGEFTKVNDKLIKAESELKSLKGIKRILKAKNINELKEEKSGKITLIKESIAADRDAAHTKGNESLQKIFENALDVNLEGKRDEKAITELAESYVGKIPEGFPIGDPKAAANFIKQQLKANEESFESVQGYLNDRNPDKPFESWDELSAALTPKARTAFGELDSEESQNILKMFNDAIKINNAQKFLTEREGILKKSSKPKAETAAPQAEEIAEAVAGTEEVLIDVKNKTKVEKKENEGEIVKTTNKEVVNTPTVTAKEQSETNQKSIDDLGLNLETNTRDGLNKNGITILENLSDENLNGLEINQATMTDAGGKNNRGLEGIVKLQTYFNVYKIKGADGEELETDGFAGKNTINALKAFFRPRS